MMDINSEIDLVFVCMKGNELNVLWPAIVVELRNLRIAGKVARPLLTRAMNEHLETVRVDLALCVATHLRVKGLSPLLRKTRQGSFIHYIES